MDVFSEDAGGKQVGLRDRLGVGREERGTGKCR